MKIEQIRDGNKEGFGRLTGIKLSTFEVMLKILRKGESLLKEGGVASGIN